jgi:hypothetical protein
VRTQGAASSGLGDFKLGIPSGLVTLYRIPVKAKAEARRLEVEAIRAVASLRTFRTSCAM